MVNNKVNNMDNNMVNNKVTNMVINMESTKSINKKNFLLFLYYLN